MAKAKRLFFELGVPATENLREVMSVHGAFFPNGRTGLNKDTWRGLEPGSCGVTRVHSRKRQIGDPQPIVLEIEVSYRPKGYISYVGRTPYDGWTAKVVQRRNDGVYLTVDGQPLKDGEPLVYKEIETHVAIDFNALNFGTFVREEDVSDVRHMTVEEIRQAEASLTSFSSSLESSFIAPHRHRPLKKIILSNNPSGWVYDGFGTNAFNLCNDTERLDDVLLDKLEELMHEFIEGKISIQNETLGDMTYVELTSSLVECTQNEHGLDSWFDMLNSYTPIGFLNDLAKRLMSVYAIDVAVVPGKGLVLQRTHGRTK